MSNIYIQEPPTKGKVLLETTVGDIEVELWPREAPLACRNFVQLCMEKYYHKTKFHRVVRDFIVQGGDPTGTGNGGESIYGKPFKDEFHSRLRFVRRGLVAMANAGKDDNASQFFFTMGPTQELQNKHTIFGKVVGDTIYNMIRLQEGVPEGEETPENPHKILKTKVLNNPFPDIEPRQVIEMIKDEKKDKRPKSKMKATKDFGLLSFGDEAEEEEEDLLEANKAFEAKAKSSHDLLNDPKLSSEVGIKTDRKRKAEEHQDNKNDQDSDNDPDEENITKEKKEEVDMSALRKKLKKNSDKETKKSSKIVNEPDDDNDLDMDDEDDDAKEKKKRREELIKEIKALKKEIRGDKGKKETVEEDEDAKKKTAREEAEEGNEMLKEFHKEQVKHASKQKFPKKGSAREAMTMKLLEKFKSKLNSVKTDETGSEEKGNEMKDEGGDDEDDISGDSWMKNTLKFESNDPVLAKDASSKDDEWFDIFDPRNPLNKRRRGAKDQKSKK